eukprot:1437019-Prymnesium_polylepis.1
MSILGIAAAPFSSLALLAEGTLIARPLAVLASLSLRAWFGLSITSCVLYLRHISALSRSGRDSPCPSYGAVFRILYGLFGTRFAEL